MAQSTSSTQLSLSIYTASPNGGLRKFFPSFPAPFTRNRIDVKPIELPASTLAQPIPFDSNGQMQIDLLGLQQGSSQLKMWKNVWNASDDSSPLYDV